MGIKALGIPYMGHVYNALKKYKESEHIRNSSELI